MSDSPQNDVNEKVTKNTRQKYEPKRYGGALRLHVTSLLQHPFRYIKKHKYADKTHRCNKFMGKALLTIWNYVAPIVAITRIVNVAILFIVPIALWNWWNGKLSSEGLIALFTVVMTYTTWLNWAAMRAQNEIMNAQIMQEQRPWVGIILPGVDDLVIGQPFSGWFLASNTGKTPAFLQSACSDVCHFPKDTDLSDRLAAIIRALKSQEMWEQQIYANSPTHFRFIGSWNWSDEIKPVIESGDERIYVFIHLRYKDCMEHSHATLCCLRYNPDKHRLEAHRRYNRMT